MKFKDLSVGDRFTFGPGTSFPDECIKTGARKYETAELHPHYGRPLRCTVGTVNVSVVLVKEWDK